MHISATACFVRGGFSSLVLFASLADDAAAQSITPTQIIAESSLSIGANEHRDDDFIVTVGGDSTSRSGYLPRVSVSSEDLVKDGRAVATGFATTHTSQTGSFNDNSLSGQMSFYMKGAARSADWSPTDPGYSAYVSLSSRASARFLNESQAASDTIYLRWATSGGAQLNIDAPALNSASTSGFHQSSIATAHPTFDLDASMAESFVRGSHRYGGSLIWSINGPLPGLSPVAPIDEEDEKADPPVQVTGSYFAAPASAGYGLDVPVFFNTVVKQIDPASGEVTGYRVGDARILADEIAFASVVAPTATPSAGVYTLRFGDEEAQLSPGATHNFLETEPNGVLSFQLLGLGDQVLFDDASLLPSYAAGLTFAGEGLGAFRYQLLAEEGLPGDYNDDGLVDAADYTVWRDNLGSPARTLLNDIDGGAIGAAQYDTWRANYGATLAGALSSAVPEPTTVVILASAVGLAGAIRRSRNR